MADKNTLERKKMNPENIFTPCVCCGKSEYTTIEEFEKDCLFNLNDPNTLTLIDKLKVDFLPEPFDSVKVKV